MSLTTFGYFLISALAEALAMDQVITAPRLLISSMYFWTIESNCPKSKDGPVFERYLSIDVCGCLVWKFCRATCKPNQKKKKKRIHTYILKISSIYFLKSLFIPFLELPYSTFLDVWGLLLKIVDGRGISMLGGIFSNGILVLAGLFDRIYRLSSTCF